MRRAGLVLAALLAVWPGAVPAQTTVNPGALDQLAPPAANESPAPAKKPAPRSPATKPATRPATRPVARPVARPDAHAPAKPAKPAPPVVPKVAPPAPVLPPPIVVPTRPAPPPPPIPEARDAPGDATRQNDGLRVTFGVGRADLNQGTEIAVKALAHPSAPGTPTYSIAAYAGGNADDPSTPRRLALSRALAIRSVLLAAGVPSASIYVRALGEPPAGDPVSPDRVDVVVAIAAPPPGNSQP